MAAEVFQRATRAEMTGSRGNEDKEGCEELVRGTCEILALEGFQGAAKP
jgi:hypothetical protein